MDEKRFDAAIRALGNSATRRGALGLLAGVLGLRVSEATAKHRQRVRSAAKANKVTLCHHDEEANTWHPITISGNAVAQHTANHGDFEFGPNKASDCCTAADCGTGEFCAVAVARETGVGSGTCTPTYYTGTCEEDENYCTNGTLCDPSDIFLPCGCFSTLTGDTFCGAAFYEHPCTDDQTCISDPLFGEGSACVEQTGLFCGNFPPSCAVPCPRYRAQGARVASAPNGPVIPPQ